MHKELVTNSVTILMPRQMQYTAINHGSK